jgi:hypothetical protein
MFPARTRKRLAPNDSPHDVLADDQIQELHRAKRQRPNFSLQTEQKNDTAKLVAGSSTYTSYTTPPRSAPSMPMQPAVPRLHRKVPPIQTISLRLRTPKTPVPTAHERRQLAARKGAAKRWVPKLQDPFPRQSEIKKAYPYKLMRHYPAAPASVVAPSFGNTPPASTVSPSESSKSALSSAPAAQASADNFIKPVIQKSARLTKLLQNFPALAIPRVSQESNSEIELIKKEVDERTTLLGNMNTTRFKEAQRLAWKAFAKPDCNGNREVMVESALPLEDLEKEHAGIPNNLPSWKKWNTSKYFQEKAVKKEK